MLPMAISFQALLHTRLLSSRGREDLSWANTQGRYRVLRDKATPQPCSRSVSENPARDDTLATPSAKNKWGPEYCKPTIGFWFEPVFGCVCAFEPTTFFDTPLTTSTRDPDRFFCHEIDKYAHASLPRCLPKPPISSSSSRLPGERMPKVRCDKSGNFVLLFWRGEGVDELKKKEGVATLSTLTS